jgi:Zn-dependent M28 family amino/carboxypeptidase
MIQKNQKVRLNMSLSVAMTKADSGFNVIAEIPGTDLKDEIVMIGAHFDSWHAGTGATDNGTGSSVTMEAMRILQTLAHDGMRPRRTIRIGLWGGEEQGLNGSREYVSQYFGKSSSDRLAQMMGGGTGEIQKTPAYEKFSVYFNNDNGGGKVRGVYLQGNEAARPVLRAWLGSLADPTAQTLTLDNTGGTDHLSYDAIGLPGFQFIQDPIEYSTRTHHSNMDVYDRIQEEDLKQAAVFMAAFAYQAAVRDEMFPRKPAAPPRQRATGSN